VFTIFSVAASETVRTLTAEFVRVGRSITKVQSHEEVAMSFSSRVLGVIERELSKQLSFSFRDLTVDDPARLSLQDNIGFAVWIRNDADFPLSTIWGLIEPTAVTQFRPIRFRIGTLRPRESQQVATIEALIIGQPDHGILLDQLGTVDVSATADLSEIVFAEWDKPLVYAPAAGPIPACETLPKSGVMRGLPPISSPSRLSEPARRSIPAGAIPLSKVDA
jgi:hypothetical protein